MRPAAIAIIGFTFLLLVIVFVVYVQLALLCLALVVCVMITFGLLCDGQSQRSFWIATRTSEANAAPPNAVVKIEGRAFSVHELPARLDLTLRRRNLPLVIAMALVAVCAVVVCMSATDLLKPLEPETPRYLLFYGLCYLLAILFFPAMAWLSECALMHNAAITLANVGERRGGLNSLWVSYQFIDQAGAHYGGSTLNINGPRGDHLKVVFCSPRDPWVSKLSCGLLFHEVVWLKPSNRS